MKVMFQKFRLFLYLLAFSSCFYSGATSFASLHFFAENIFASKYVSSLRIYLFCHEYEKRNESDIV